MPSAHWTRYQKWSVFWYSRKKKKYVRKRFQEDIGAALKFFTENQDKPMICMHVDNHGYPPPLHITAHERVTWKIVRRNGKKYKKRVTTIVNLMNDYNTKGVWWCPYCIKLRRFELTHTERGAEMYCPVCKISNYESTVRTHNPKAVLIEQHKQQRRTNGKPRRRRR